MLFDVEVEKLVRDGSDLLEQHRTAIRSDEVVEPHRVLSPGLVTEAGRRQLHDVFADHLRQRDDTRGIRNDHSVLDGELRLASRKHAGDQDSVMAFAAILSSRRRLT